MRAPQLRAGPVRHTVYRRALHVRLLRAAVRRTLDLDGETTVLIRQRGRPAPAGTGIETVVALVAPGQPVCRWVVPRPVEEVLPEDLNHLFLRRPLDASTGPSSPGAGSAGALQGSGEAPALHSPAVKLGTGS